MKRIFLMIAVAFLCAPAMGQSFQCRIGQDAACLDWGESVCTSGGKCVSENAECFEAYQCDYKGFACKSDVEECVESHDRIVTDYNALLRDHEALRAAGVELSEAYDDLKDDYETLQQDVHNLQSARDDAESCLYMADSLEDAKTCLD